jgi:hypothetical protein
MSENGTPVIPTREEPLGGELPRNRIPLVMDGKVISRNAQLVDLGEVALTQVEDDGTGELTVYLREHNGPRCAIVRLTPYTAASLRSQLYERERTMDKAVRERAIIDMTDRGYAISERAKEFAARDAEVMAAFEKKKAEDVAAARELATKGEQATAAVSPANGHAVPRSLLGRVFGGLAKRLG